MVATAANNVCPICKSEWDGEGICLDCALDKAILEALEGKMAEVLDGAGEDEERKRFIL